MLSKVKNILRDEDKSFKVFLVVMFISLWSGILCVSQHNKTMQQQAITAITTSNYSISVDGFNVNTEDILDVKTFVKKHHIVEIDNNNKSIKLSNEG